jgi:hypothetical protein
MPRSRLGFTSGRIKSSRRGLFERNGTSGTAIYEHPNFLKYLRYFLEGAALPVALIDTFCQKVDDCGHVSGSDALELAYFARSEVRRRGMEPKEASEEFYRLALDCGVYQGHANTIREIVARVRVR